jgi:hypothetical protein
MKPRPTPYDYALIPPGSSDEDAQASREALVRLSVFLERHVIRRGEGLKVCPQATAARLLVLESILQPTGGSLRSLARELGCSAAMLSKIGLQFSEAMGTQAPWQRVHLREQYRQRALGVHHGTWQCSDQWQRDRYRIARRKLSLATDPMKPTAAAAPPAANSDPT